MRKVALSSETAPVFKRNEKGRFVAGTGGHGRRKGSRNKLAEDFVDDLHAVWQAQGKRAIEKTAKDRPHELVKVVASLLPRDVNLNVSAAERFGQIIEAIEQGQADAFGGISGGIDKAKAEDVPAITTTYKASEVPSQGNADDPDMPPYLKR